MSVKFKSNHKIAAVFIAFLFIFQTVQGQDWIPMIDSVYMSHIKSVQVYPVGRQLDSPVIPLGKDQLTISFDDMGYDNPYLRYTVIHCDRYWEPSDLHYNEYISGFENVLLEKSAFSFSTYQPYRHWEFVLPNNDMDIKLSGNYLLIVYEEDSGNLVFSKRFQVYEGLLKLNFDIVRPVFGNRYRTGQQIELSAHAQNLNISNPLTNLSAAISQNGKWYYEFIKEPRSTSGNNFHWNYTDEPVFDGGREFRLMDLRTTNSAKMGIDSIRYFLDTINLYKTYDYARAGHVHHDISDLDGAFFIVNEDRTQNSAISSQYVKAHFILKHGHEEPQDIYVIGGLTNWNFIPEAKMKYDHKRKEYRTTLFLKQGVYAYLYATKGEYDIPDFSLIEGNDFNTENSYDAFVYYRTMADRYDRLIGYLSYPQVRR